MPRAPVVDVAARGAFLGLTTATDPGALFRAVLEGLAMEARLSVDAVSALPGVGPPEEIRVIGGGTRNALLLRIKAAVYGRELTVIDAPEATALGAALLGGIAAGVWPNLAARAGCDRAGAADDRAGRGMGGLLRDAVRGNLPPCLPGPGAAQPRADALRCRGDDRETGGKHMRRRTLGAALAALGLTALAAAPADAAGKKLTIALIPGLTTDAFYITMHKGAQAAADALGDTLVFQGAPEFNAVLQVPVLDAVIARHPDAILIAPTDKVQLIQPLKKAVDAGIKVITVDTFIGTGKYQTGGGDADFPLSYVASDNILGGQIAARALAKAIGDKGKVYVSNVKPGVSTTDQREEGFKDEMKNHPGITVLDDAVQRRRRQQGGEPVAVGAGAQPRSGRRVRRQPVLGAGRGQRRQAGGQGGQDQGRRVRRAEVDRRAAQERARRYGDRAAPVGDRLFRRGGGARGADRPFDPDRDRHRVHGDHQGQRGRSEREPVPVFGLIARPSPSKRLGRRGLTPALPQAGEGVRAGCCSSPSPACGRGC